MTTTHATHIPMLKRMKLVRKTSLYIRCIRMNGRAVRCVALLLPTMHATLGNLIWSKHLLFSLRTQFRWLSYLCFFRRCCVLCSLRFSFISCHIAPSAHLSCSRFWIPRVLPWLLCTWNLILNSLCVFLHCFFFFFFVISKVKRNGHIEMPILSVGKRMKYKKNDNNNLFSLFSAVANLKRNHLEPHNTNRNAHRTQIGSRMPNRRYMCMNFIWNEQWIACKQDKRI